MNCKVGCTRTRWLGGASVAALAACGASAAPDVCKRAGVPAAVELGAGRASYAALASGEMLAVEAGPQGGHHVWLALRTQGLATETSFITVTGQVEAIAASVGPFETHFELQPADGAWCEVSGIRFQIDQQRPVADFAGQTMRITVRVHDVDGAEATDARDAVLTL